MAGRAPRNKGACFGMPIHSRETRLVHRAFGNHESPKPRPGALNNRQLADELCAGSCTLREARRAHVQSFGTLIPHVFMGSVLAHVGRCVLQKVLGKAASRAEMLSILQTLESAMDAGDRETRNVIAISFVRDAELEPFFRLLRPHMGPKMSLQLRG